MTRQNIDNQTCIFDEEIKIGKLIIAMSEQQAITKDIFVFDDTIHKFGSTRK